MVTWENRIYELTLSSVGENIIKPKPYRFHLEPVSEGQEIYFYKAVPEQGNPPGQNPFKGCVLLPQGGRKLTKFVAEKLNPGNPATYPAKLQLLIDEIVEDKVKEDPSAYERLVGFISFGNQPVNPVSFYRVEHTHQDDNKLLVVVLISLLGGNPNGTIAVIS